MGIPWQARVSLFWLICAFIFMLVSHFSPYWYMEGPYTHIGLWAKCEWRKPCVWGNIQPDWWKHCQGGFIFGLLCVFVSLILTTGVNVFSNIKVRYKIINIAVMGFAKIEIAITLAYFGRKAHVEREVEIAKEAYRNFGWAFLLGCIGDLLLLIALIFFVLYTTKHRRKRMETPEVNPAIGLSTLSVTPGTPLPAVGSGAPVRSIDKTTSSVHLPY